MRAFRLPAVVWALVLAASLASIFTLAAALPDRVARHFSFSGRANGWSGRVDYAVIFMLTDLVVAFFLPALCYSFRFFPSRTLNNVPNRDYWRSPEHYPEACNFLFRHAFWFGALLAAWVAWLNLLVVQANLSDPPHLSAQGIVGLTIALFVGLGLWIRPLLRFFRRVPAPVGRR